MASWIRDGDLRKLLTLTISAAAILVAIVALQFVRSGVPEEEPMASLEKLEDEGVIFLEDHDAFLVFVDGEPLALSADAQHVGDDVVYCPTSELFESPAHGEKFDKSGIYFGGPARRSLDRYPIEVRDGWVYVDLDDPIEGPERGEVTPREPVGPLCVG